MWKANTEGDTVVRPLMMEFPDNPKTFEIDEQFLWGPSFLISPALTENNTVNAFFPKEADWYNYFTGEKVSGEFEKIETALDQSLRKL